MKAISFVMMVLLSHAVVAENIPSAILSAMSKDKSRGYGELYGAKAKECFYVVDQDGNPVEEARIRGAFWTGGGMNDYVPVDGLTNTNGEYVAEGKSRYKLRYTVSKDGYYSTNGEVVYVNTQSVPAVKDGKWQPYGTRRSILLRRQQTSKQLCVLSEDIKDKKWLHPGEWFIPFENKWLGFDLELFDWVAPYGKGRCNDMLLRFRSDIKRRLSDYRYDMDVSFTNNPYAGVYRMRKIDGSEFQWVYKADTNAVFESTQSFYFERHPGKRTVDCKLSDVSYLVFRTRTKLDEEGNLISAHYGVISGGWGFGSKVMGFSDACFNPVPNDTNIEDGYYLRKRIRERKKWQKEEK